MEMEGQGLIDMESSVASVEEAVQHYGQKGGVLTKPHSFEEDSIIAKSWLKEARDHVSIAILSCY